MGSLFFAGEKSAKIKLFLFLQSLREYVQQKQDVGVHISDF